MGGLRLVSSPLGKWSQASTTKGNNYEIKSEYSPNKETTNTHILLSINAENLFVKNPNYGEAQSKCEAAFTKGKCGSIQLLIRMKDTH
jgi:hypothetical protein